MKKCIHREVTEKGFDIIKGDALEAKMKCESNVYKKPMSILKKLGIIEEFKLERNSRISILNMDDYMNAFISSMKKIVLITNIK